jgi:hypothetical protein
VTFTSIAVFHSSLSHPKVKAATTTRRSKKMAPPERCCTANSVLRSIYWALAKVGSGKAQTQTRMPAGLHNSERGPRARFASVMRAANEGAPINKICPAAGSTTNQHGSQLTSSFTFVYIHQQAPPSGAGFARNF